VRSPGFAEVTDAAGEVLAGFVAGRVLVSSSVMLGEGEGGWVAAGACPPIGIWVGGET
jgi:hypothetical protein